MPRVILINLTCKLIEIALRHGCSPVNLLYIARTPLYKNTFGGLLLVNGVIILHLKSIGTEKHMQTSGFYRYEHKYTCRRQEFQNILKRKLCYYFGQSLLIY